MKGGRRGVKKEGREQKTSEIEIEIEMDGETRCMYPQRLSFLPPPVSCHLASADSVCSLMKTWSLLSCAQFTQLVLQSEIVMKYTPLRHAGMYMYIR